MNVGDTCNMHSLRVDDCGLYMGREFIVVEWYNGDRVAGSVQVQFRDNGERGRWSEDGAPNVTYLGKGKRVVTIEWPDPK